MKLTLPLRVLLLLVAINLGVLAAGTAFLSTLLQHEGERLERERSDALVYTLRSTVQSDRRLNVASILQWPTWSQFADAVILDDNYWVATDGSVAPRGVRLNPVGLAGRSPALDEQAVLRSIARAVETGGVQEDVEGGRAVPIRQANGTWGGCWYRPRPREQRGVVRLFLIAFGASTLLLTAVTFSAIRRLVLRPVEALAAAARRIAAGDLETRVEAPPRSDELADLMRTFNGMTSYVQGYNERLEADVRAATEKALQAEAAAITQQRLAAMGELAAGIAHEINNPLGGLQNAVESLASGRLSDERRAVYLDLLSTGLARIQTTVGQLLRFTPREAEVVPLQLFDPLADAVALVRHRAGRLGVALVFAEGGEEEERALRALPPVRGSAHEIAQAVLNLLVNALDALEERGRGGRVEVTLRDAGDEQVVVVADDGPGVPADVLARVADLFYTTKDVGKGTGLGLALVHNVLAAHGGSVRLDSAPGQGFRAELRFPVDGGPGGERAR